MFKSSEIIDRVLKSLGLETESVSNYQDYTLPNGDLLRLRISDHGINLSTWHRKNKEAREIDPKVPKLDKSTNIAVTFQPTKEECEEKGVAFPQKIINKTQVKTDSGNNVKPQFSVGHICYASWLLSEDEINLIVIAITNFVNNGIYCDPIGLDSGKVLAWHNTSNIPPRKLTTNTDTIKFKDKNNQQTNENKTMVKKQTIRINENQLRRIVSESVKKMLKEGYSDDDVYLSNYYDAMSDYYADNKSFGLNDVLEILNSHGSNIPEMTSDTNPITYYTNILAEIPSFDNNEIDKGLVYGVLGRCIKNDIRLRDQMEKINKLYRWSDRMCEKYC